MENNNEVFYLYIILGFSLIISGIYWAVNYLITANTISFCWSICDLGFGWLNLFLVNGVFEN